MRYAFGKPTLSVLSLFVWVATTSVTSCTPSQPNELDKLGTVALTIKGRSVNLWIADEHDERVKGLMFVTSEEMADLPDGTKRGMIFVFEFEQHLSFWMKNTIIPLDIAYLDSAGKVLAIHTMPALDDRTGLYSSGSPARFAIEVNENVWAEIGLEVGDTIALPEELRTTNYELRGR